MIDIARLNKRITFVKCTEHKNELEQSIQGYLDVKTVWASLEPVSGKEFYNANKTENQTAYTVYVRYTKDITPDMLIKYKKRKFYISAVLNVMEKNEILKIMCYEKDGDTFE